MLLMISLAAIVSVQFSPFGLLTPIIFTACADPDSMLGFKQDDAKEIVDHVHKKEKKSGRKKMRKL